MLIGLGTLSAGFPPPTVPLLDAGRLPLVPPLKYGPYRQLLDKLIGALLVLPQEETHQARTAANHATTTSGRSRKQRKNKNKKRPRRTTTARAVLVNPRILREKVV